METAKEVDLKEVLKILVKKWWIIVLMAVGGSIVAYSFTAIFITPTYEAKTVLYIGQEDSGLGSIGISLGQLEADSQLIIDYKQLAVTRLVIDAVTKNTRLKIVEDNSESNSWALGKQSTEDAMNMTYKEFQNNTIIETVENSRLFTVGFIHSDPEIARLVSDELAKQLTLAVLEVVGVQNIRILDQAVLPQKPVAPNKMQNTLVGGLMGFIASLIIIVMIFIFSNTIKNEEDIESLIGISVLGDIPEFKKGGK
jgi:capsular polysaccharide biosynthesis protein